MDKVDFNLDRGDIFCLMGPNGSGKSIILKSIIDQIKFLGGTMTLVNRDLDKLTIMERAREISVVLTERVSPDLMTAREIVSTGRYPHTNHFGKLAKEDIRIIDESIAIVNGKDLEDKEFKSLSDGEKQRIMIARAICQEADIMVLDEPTSFLDIRYKLELLNILDKLAIDKKKTIIMSLHEIDLVTKIADKVMLIDQGSVYGYGRPEEAIRDESIRQVYKLNMGSFHTGVGNIELGRLSKNKPEVFVIGGNGLGTNIYRALNKSNKSFYSGIVFDNDLDYLVSKSLAWETVTSPAFEEIGEEGLKRAKELISESKCIIDSGVSLEGINSRNRELLAYARKNKIPVFSLRSGGDEFSSKNYLRIWDIIENEL